MLFTSGLRNTIVFFFFNDTATTEIYTLSLHDALPIYRAAPIDLEATHASALEFVTLEELKAHRSEEHTSELQSQSNLVCRLLLEKKKKLRLERGPNSTRLASSTVSGPSRTVDISRSL